MASDPTTPAGRPLTPEELARHLGNQLATEKELREQAEANLDAIRAEFTGASTSAEAIKIARKFIEESLPEAVITIKYLIANAESESVRSSLSKFVVSSVLDKKHEDTEPEELRKLIEGLRGNDSQPAPAPVESNDN